MRKASAILLIIMILLGSITLCPFAAYAAENDPPAPTVPQIRIVTENGNGTTLEKDDDYVNATISITDTDGAVLTGSVLFKVRGNSTALSFVKKKSFTFKYDKKTAVLGMNKGKKWALLANLFDPTLIRNEIAFDFAEKIGLSHTVSRRYVELWVDDSFRGCYQLTEPIQVSKERLNIDIESNGGMNDFLIEREATRNESDVTYFTVDGIRFAVKEPETPTDEQLNYIRSTVSDVMTAVKSGDRETAAEKIDVPTFARFYLLNELCKTVDFDFSSVFFYYKGGKLYAGPAWDYDLSLGNSNRDLSEKGKMAADPTGLFAADCHLFKYLCAYDWFRKEVRELYRQHFGDVRAICADGGVIDALLGDYGDIFARNYSDAGWNVAKWWVNVQKKPLATYEENIAYLREWLTARNFWLHDEFGCYLIGDSDNDLFVTVLDATHIQRYLAEYPTEDVDRMVVRSKTGGEALSILDATAIQRKLADYGDPGSIGEPALY